MKQNHGLQEFRRRYHWRNGPGMLPIALAVWGVMFGAVYFVIQVGQHFGWWG